MILKTGCSLSRQVISLIKHYPMTNLQANPSGWPSGKGECWNVWLGARPKFDSP